MKNLVIYIHGKGGSAAEAAHYVSLFPESDVVGFDYKAQTPWDARAEFSSFFDLQSRKYASVTLIANSIGAFFALSSLADKKIDRAFLISPVVDMNRLICDMLLWANVSEKELEQRREIATNFGETLSWEYLCYVRSNPIRWNIPTCVLYGENDTLVPYETVCRFIGETGASLTVMPSGEHWFHTDEQMSFLDRWITASRRKEA